MREQERVYTGVEHWNVVEFDSLSEFYNYICDTPINETFRWETLSSSRTDSDRANWTGTSSFNEASDLLRNGWTIGAEKLTKALKVAQLDTQQQTAYRNVLSVCGYQAIVPLYLQGVPNSMVNKKLVPVKQKVLTLNKLMSVSACVSAKTMEEESIKCFQIIKKIEESGIRVNLNLMISTGHACVKIRLKSAGERLNVSKLAFPLVHPSMFRRLYFRFVETYPTIPKSFSMGYGRVPSEGEFKKCCGKNEVLLPTLLRGTDESDIQKLSVDELLGRLS